MSISGNNTFHVVLLTKHIIIFVMIYFFYNLAK